MIRVAIIADDLTGALDTASPFACRGAHTVCLTDFGAIAGNALPEADVVSVSTNSRHMAPQRAADAVRAAAEEIKALRPEIVLKKIDSRLKGNVLRESAAVASVFGHDRLLVVPAAPDIGRVVKSGNVVGHGVETPVSVTERFARCQLPAEVPNVTTQDVMSDLARAYLESREGLVVCSRGFAVALAEHMFPGPVRSVPALELPVLIAIGSRDEVTAAQRLALCRRGQFVCLEAVAGRESEELPATDRLLLHCGGAMEQQSEAVASNFAEGVRRAVAGIEPRTMLCSGGDTALAILLGFGQMALHVLGEIAPGLPISKVKLAGRDVGFISKSGGFGGASMLVDVFAVQPGEIRLA